jgi:transcriptional regulator GlxA family with amidase domain
MPAAADGRILSMPRNTATRRHTVVALIGNGVSPFEFAVACEIFGIDRSQLGVPWYRFAVCSEDPSPVSTAVAGVSIAVEHGLATLRRADTIVVVPMSGSPEEPAPALHAALRSAHARGARILSLCTGAFTLAAAGLLDDRPATTHWRWADLLAERYPRVRVDPRVLYVDDGDILTSAGSAAGIDLCLHVVRKDFGAEVANAVARAIVVPPHREGGQAQYLSQPVRDVHASQLFAETLDWALGHLDEDLPVHVLAHRSAMSPRTFARRFREATGTTPHQWVLRQRVLFAQRLLEATDLPIDLVAGQSGLGSATNLRQQFQRVVGTAPSAYRRTFRTAV